MGAPRTKQWESLVEFVDALRTCLGLETYENIRNRKAAALGGEVMKRRARAKRGRIAAGPLALVMLAGCAHAPTPIAPTEHAACSTAAAPELTSCPYREELPKTVLYTSSGLECENCNAAEFSR